MIATSMKYLGIVSILMVILVAIYIVLKIAGSIQDYQIKVRRYSEPTPKEIEIISRDLFVKAENLLDTVQVYELQLVQLKHDIEDIDDELKVYMPDSAKYKLLVDRSLRYQERKCMIEAKVIKINKELTDIALEEYRRRVM